MSEGLLDKWRHISSLSLVKQFSGWTKMNIKGLIFYFNQDVPSPLLVLSTTRLTITGIRQMGVITKANTTAGGGSLNSSVGHVLKYSEWMLTKRFSTGEFGHGIKRQSDISSVQCLKLLYKLETRRIGEGHVISANVLQYLWFQNE